MKEHNRMDLKNIGQAYSQFTEKLQDGVEKVQSLLNEVQSVAQEGNQQAQKWSDQLENISETLKHGHKEVSNLLENARDFLGHDDKAKK